MTRVFNVVVTGCKDCPHITVEFGMCLHVGAIDKDDDFKMELIEENYEAITESCPMYQHSFVKDEKK